VDTLELGIIVLDKDGTVCCWNSWLSSHSVTSAEDALGKHISEVFDKMPLRVQEGINSVIASKQSVFLSTALNRAPFPLFANDEAALADLRIYQLVQMRPLIVNGEPGCIVQISDVSASARREESLRVITKEAQLARNAQRDFLSQMSHEIRTPLNGVIALTELVLQSELHYDQRNHLKLVHESGVSLLGIINDILDFSKIDAGKMPLDEHPTNLRRILGNIEGVLRIRSEQKGIDLRVRVDESLPHGLLLDGPRVQQILMNLLGNAIKFTEAGEVRTEVRYVEDSPNARFLKISVHDTGIGIADPTMLFKDFSQAEEGTTRRFGGSGLGLAISQRLAKLMRGKITVESEYGKGSTFTLVIPTHSVVVGPSIVPEALAPLLGGHALVVDDNRVNRLVAGKVLERLGYTAKQVEGGPQAIEAVAIEKFDVILMDCQMPEMDGFETTKRLRQLIPLEIPIIAVTANALSGERERCLQAGMNDYLTKPITIKGLSLTLQNAGAIVQLSSPSVPTEQIEMSEISLRK